MPDPAPAQRLADQLSQLADFSRALTYAVTLDEVSALVVGRAAGLLRAERSALLLADDEGVLRVRAARGIAASARDHFRAAADGDFDGRLRRLLGGSASAAFIGVPLVADGVLTGVLAVSRALGAAVSEEEEALLAALADQVSVALEKKRLDEVAAFRERLIGIVSHDLRNPIAAILMTSETLAGRAGLGSGERAAVMRMQRAAARAQRMIADLLDFTQARLGGGIPIVPRSCDLGAIATQTVDELRPTASGRQIDVHVRGEVLGFWDGDRLAQVVGNLVANALAHGDAAAAVQVEVCAAEDGVQLRVVNRGTPILPARRAALFEPMRRDSEPPTAFGRSLGLGLYIVKQIVEAHGGAVDLHSPASERVVVCQVDLPRRPPALAVR